MPESDASNPIPTSLLGSCRYNDQLHIINMKLDSTLMEVYELVLQKWGEIHPDELVLQYLAPRERLFVKLSSDQDVMNMINLHLYTKTYVVDMIVSCKGDPNRRRKRVRGDDNRGDQNEGEDDPHGNEDNQGNPSGNSVDVWRHCIRGENQVFRDPDEFRLMIRNYCIANNRTYKIERNSREKIAVVCPVEKCTWRVYASLYKSDKLFAIRKCNLEHTCGDATLSTRGHPKAIATWVSSIVKKKLRTQSSYRPVSILDDIRTEYGVHLKYHTAWRGKEIAMREIHGDEASCYDRLRRYCSALTICNPGSIAEYETDPATQKFLRVFISFGSSILGFLRACRPMINFDGAHIKNKYQGCLLSAVCKDPNDQLYTLAYAVVDAENNRNWEWFVVKLKQILDYHTNSTPRIYTFFSDRHVGLIDAIPRIFPGSHHAYCLRHLTENFKKQVLTKYPLHNKKRWTKVLYDAAYAPTRQEFLEIYNNIVQTMPLAKEWIDSTNPNCWACAYFSGDRWGVMNNNQSECWNSWVKEERFLPVPSMIDGIRLKMMEAISERREESLTWTGTLCPNIEKKLSVNYKASRYLRVSRSTTMRFEVHNEGKSYGVDLERMTCTCKTWQLEKIPCKHACASIESKGLSVFEFTDRCFRVDSFKLLYDFPINPIPSFDEDIDLHREYNPNGAIINAPVARAPPGRRKTKRMASRVETQTQTRQLRCSRCKKSGHNRRGCKQPIP